MANVLLVDDEEALRIMMERQLRRAGHEVTTAPDGMAAVELLQNRSFDVIVSDMKMPRLDGMGLLTQAARLAPDTEFIILTGHGNMENAVEAFKSGNVFDYLLKPLDDIHELDAVVGRAAERRLLRSENSRLTCELALQAENQRLVQELEIRIAELEDARQCLTRMAERDGLTDLYNHRTIHAKLESAVKAASSTVITVIVVDLDGFKRLNDTYGHLVGDRALQHLAGILRAESGPDALIGRSGGDEFLIVLSDTNVQEATYLPQSIKVALETRPFNTPCGASIPLRLSFGLADTNTSGASHLNLLVAADAALYEGKKRGGNTITLYLADSESTTCTTFDVLEGLVTAIDNKDQYTHAHSIDVAEYALSLVEAMGCSPEIHDIVRVAGLLHDVGKIGVPDSVLCKPGRLTPDEYEVMKKHVTLSALIIHGLPNLGEILDAVSCHHERWDGGGYPKGLAGDQIPLLGRVLAIADAFSAMTLDRPYRVALSCEAALKQIEEGAGTQFDPDLARLFAQAMRRKIAQDRVLQKAA